MKPLRVLIVLPSWVGDAVMATPALRLVRDALKGSFIGALARPGIDEVLAGSAAPALIDEFHVDRAAGIMGPKRVAAKLRARRYDSTLLLTNSFSTALVTRLAFIPERVGYDRDGRGLLLTRRIKAPMREGATGLAAAGVGRSGFALESAVDYYLRAAEVFLEGRSSAATLDGSSSRVGAEPRLELGVTPEQDAAAADVLERAGVRADQPFALLNPGGNDPAKRWPPDRFAAVGAHLARVRGCRMLVTGSPGERELVNEVVAGIEAQAPAAAASLIDAGVSLGALKGVVRRCAEWGGGGLMVTNDTGPRHIAAALGLPCVTLFGPTDHRWTTLPGPPGLFETILADPTLPPGEVANDHPERCSIDRISVERVIEGAERLLRSRGAGAIAENRGS